MGFSNLMMLSTWGWGSGKATRILDWLRLMHEFGEFSVEEWLRDEDRFRLPVRFAG